MSFKNIGTVLSNVQKGSVGLTDTLKGLGSLEEAANALKYVDQFTDKDKIGLLKGAFKDVDDDAARAALNITDLGDSMASTTKQAGGLGTAIKGMFKADPIGSWLSVGTTALGIISSIVTYFKQQDEELARQGQEAGAAWTESLASMDEYAAQYTELREQLESGELSESETLSVKQQILDIQNQIVDTYGNQASGIDLVNGALDTQLAKMQQITQEAARSDWNENSEAYERAYEKIVDDTSVLISGSAKPGSTLIRQGEGVYQEVRDIIESFEDLSLTENVATGMENFSIATDDIIERRDVLDDFITQLNLLKQEYSEDDFASDYIQGIINDATEELNKASATFEENSDAFYGGLSSHFEGYYEDGAKILDDYTKAVQNYNEALTSGDVDSAQIEAARSAYEDASAAKDEFLSTDGAEQFSYLFDQVYEQLDKSAARFSDVQEILAGGKLSKSNMFADVSEDINRAVEGIEKLNVDAFDIQVAIDTPGSQKAEESLRTLAELLNFDLTSDTDLEEFIDLLVELGIVSDNTGVTIEEAASRYEEFSGAIQSAIDSVEQLNSIMGESTSGAGLSSESLAAFREMFGDDAEKALEKTANGYHLNEEALHELQQKQEEMVKTDYLSALSEQYDNLRQATIDLAQAQLSGEDTSPFLNQIESIQENIQNLNDLQLEYEATTSAYQQWQNAMSDGSERDMYENIQSGYAQITDLIERGWGGSEEVRTYVDLLSSADLSTASVEEVMDAYNRLGQTIGNTGYRILDFFTVDEDGNSTTDGIYNFFDTVNAVLGDEFAKINENGDYEFNFLDGGDQKVAEQLGMDVEAVQSILRAAADAGFVVNLDQPIQSMEELKTSAQEAKDALAAMQDTSLSNINLDASSYDEITNSISAVQGYIEEVNNSDLELNVKEDKLEEANTLLDYLVQRKSELASSEITLTADTEDLQTQIAAAESALESFRNEDGTFNISAEGYDEAVNNLSSLYSLQQDVTNNSVVMSIDVSQLQGETQNAITMVQQLQTAISDLNVQNQLKDVGVDIDTGAAEQKVYTLVTQLQGLDDDAKVELGLNTEAFDQALASIQNTVEVGANISPDALTTIQNAINGISAEALVKFGVDKTLVDAYAAENKDDTAKVKYEVDASEVTEFMLANHDTSAELRYTATVDMAAVDRNITGTITYQGTTSGTGSVNGTAHAFGTVQDMKLGYYRSRGFNAHAMGDWALPAPETALVNELGTEGLVRDGKFSLIPGGAHLQNFKRGDIIFNHKQVQELLANGYVTSGGGHGRMVRVNGSAYNMLNAYSSGSGPSRRPSRPSYSMDEAYIASNTDDAKDTSDAYSEAASSISDATEAAEEFNETIDWIEVIINRTERAIDKLSKTAGNTYELFTTRNNALSQQISKTTEEINLQQRAYDRYIQQANSVGLSEDWAAKARNGLVDIEDITDENLKSLIDDYSEWYEKALDCADAIDDLKISVQELYEERFNNVVTEFDGMIGQLQDRSDLLDAYIDQTETKGYLLSSNYYSELMKVENQILSNLQSQRDAMNNALNEAVAAGQIKEYSESWYDMRSQIDEVTQAIVESETALIEYQNSIRQLQWDAFDLIQERISDINDEAEFLMDLLDANDLFDEHGKTTDSGAATFGLLGVRYNTYMQQADMYRKEMEELDAQIAKDPANQTLLKRRQELLEAQRESISAAEDEKDAIRDLVEEGINAQLESLQNLIDKYKDLMDEQRRAYEYQQDMAEQSKEIADLEKQLAAYAGDNSEEGRLQRQEIENQLADARQNLQDTQYDQQISETEKLLDDLYEQYELILNSRLDNLDQLVSDVINNINLEASNIRDTIVSEADSVGYDLTNAMNTIWSESGSIGTILSNYSGNFTTTMTTLQAAIDEIKNYVADMAGVSDTEASGNIGNANSSTAPSQPSVPSTPPAQNTTPQNSSNSGSFFIHKKDSYAKSKLDINNSIVDKSLSTLNSLDCGNTLRAFSATT